MPSPSKTLEAAQLADRLQFDSLWLSEDPDGWDAFSTLAAIARATESIRLGPGVTNPYLRHPNLIAASVATLDWLSDGRGFLGLGRGQEEWYRLSLGIATASGLQALEETIELLRQWASPPYRATGHGHFEIADWARTFPPAQSPPGPPIYLAATGPKTQQLAGRMADGVRFNELASPNFLAGSIARVRESARSAGRDPASLAFFVHPGLTITEDVESELQRKKSTIAVIHALPGMERQLETPGFDVAAIMSDVRQYMDTEQVLARGGSFDDLRRYGDLSAAKAAIPDELVERVAIVGSLTHAKARLQELAALGATHCFLDLDTFGPDAESIVESLRA